MLKIGFKTFIAFGPCTAIKEKLSSLDIVKSFKVNAYSLRYAKITIEFKESFYDVINSLKANNFKISRNDGKIILQTNN